MSGRRGVRSVVARLLGCAVLVAALAGCAVDATVTVSIRPDGSGQVSATVVADAAAVRVAEAGGGTLEERIRLTDLAAAGWTVSPWDRRPDGAAAVTVAKPFSDVDQVAGILDEISGPSGPLREASVRRSSSFFGVTDRVGIAVDLGGATTGISQDPALVDRIGAEGVDVGSIDAQLLDALRSSLTVTLVVELPGGTRRSVTVAPGATGRLDVAATDRDLVRIGLLAAAAVLVVVAAALRFGPRRRRRRGAGRNARRGGGSGPPRGGGRPGGGPGRGGPGRGGGPGGRSPSVGTGSGRGPAPVARPVVSPGGRGAPPPRTTTRRTPPASPGR